MPKTWRKIFTQKELQHILGERVLVAHKLDPDGATYDVTIMPVPGAENPDEYQMRVEVTETPNARGTSCMES